MCKLSPLMKYKERKKKRRKETLKTTSQWRKSRGESKKGLSASLLIYPYTFFALAPRNELLKSVEEHVFNITNNGINL